MTEKNEILKNLLNNQKEEKVENIGQNYPTSNKGKIQNDRKKKKKKTVSGSQRNKLKCDSPVSCDECCEKSKQTLKENLKPCDRDRPYLHGFLTDLWTYITPDVIDNLKEMLIKEFGMKPWEAEEFLLDQRMKAMFKSSKTKKTCEFPWVTLLNPEESKEIPLPDFPCSMFKSPLLCPSTYSSPCPPPEVLTSLISDLKKSSISEQQPNMDILKTIFECRRTEKSPYPSAELIQDLLCAQLSSSPSKKSHCTPRCPPPELIEKLICEQNTDGSHGNIPCPQTDLLKSLLCCPSPPCPSKKNKCVKELLCALNKSDSLCKPTLSYPPAYPKQKKNSCPLCGKPSFLSPEHIKKLLCSLPRSQSKKKDFTCQTQCVAQEFIKTQLNCPSVLSDSSKKRALRDLLWEIFNCSSPPCSSKTPLTTDCPPYSFSCLSLDFVCKPPDCPCPNHKQSQSPTTGFPPCAPNTSPSTSREKSIRKKKKLKKRKKIDLRYWTKKIMKIFPTRLSDNLSMMYSTKRLSRVCCISESILKHLCDITGESFTINTAKTRAQKILVILSNRIAIWLVNISCACEEEIRKLCNQRNINSQQEDDPGAGGDNIKQNDDDNTETVPTKITSVSSIRRSAQEIVSNSIIKNTSEAQIISQVTNESESPPIDNIKFIAKTKSLIINPYQPNRIQKVFRPKRLNNISVEPAKKSKSMEAGWFPSKPLTFREISKTHMQKKLLAENIKLLLEQSKKEVAQVSPINSKTSIYSKIINMDERKNIHIPVTVLYNVYSKDKLFVLMKETVDKILENIFGDFKEIPQSPINHKSRQLLIVLNDQLLKKIIPQNDKIKRNIFKINSFVACWMDKIITEVELDFLEQHQCDNQNPNLLHNLYDFLPKYNLQETFLKNHLNFYKNQSDLSLSIEVSIKINDDWKLKEIKNLSTSTLKSEENSEKQIKYFMNNKFRNKFLIDGE